jgi:hypothetical protein
MLRHWDMGAKYVLVLKAVLIGEGCRGGVSPLIERGMTAPIDATGERGMQRQHPLHALALWTRSLTNGYLMQSMCGLQYDDRKIDNIRRNIAKPRPRP